MGTVLDYVRWRGDLTFDESPQNEIDYLIFSLLSYIDYSGIFPNVPQKSPVSLQAVANSYFSLHPDPKKSDLGFLIPKDIFKLLRMVRDTRRFRGVQMFGFINEVDMEKEMQFSALCFSIGTKETVIAFRGTDDTLVGWKENLNMSFLPVIPAQLRAAGYVNEIAKDCSGNLILAGHSKGGNLAIYAGAHCENRVKDRITGIWNYDGPGFSMQEITCPEYLQIKSRIHTFIPQSSVVGILLEHEQNAMIVKSRQVALFQHDAFSWYVLGKSFIYLSPDAGASRRNDQVLNAWIREMKPEQREQFAEALYRILSSNHAKTVSDLASPKSLLLIRGMKLDKQTRKVIYRTLGTLFSEGTKGFWDDLFHKGK